MERTEEAEITQKSTNLINISKKKKKKRKNTEPCTWTFVSRNQISLSSIRFDARTKGNRRNGNRTGKKTEESIKTCAVLLRVFSTFASNVPGIWYCDGCYSFTTPGHPFPTLHPPVFPPRVPKSPAAKNVHTRRERPPNPNRFIDDFSSILRLFSRLD